jgi:carbamoyltransferase
MRMTFDVRRDTSRDMIAAVHPADLACRAQIVPDDDRHGLARILAAYRQRTGHGVLLNTSLNLHGQPIARTANDALAVFANTGLRRLQLGPYLVHKHDDPPHHP